MSGILNQMKIQDIGSNIRSKMNTRRAEMSTRFPQMGKLRGQGGILGQERPVQSALDRIKAGKMLGQGGLLGQGGILSRRPLGILGQENAFRSFGGGSVPTPGGKPGGTRSKGSYRSFVP